MTEALDNPLRRFWSGDGGARRALALATPLILSTTSMTLMHFVDRAFLGAHSDEAFAAAVPGGMLAFAFASLFFGTSTYVNTFVAQYTGADQPRRVGAAIWQGLYFCAVSWAILAPLYFLAGPIFDLAGHGADVAPYEKVYFRILILGAGFPLLNMTLGAFYSGRGKTWVVMWIRFLSVGINIPLDYVLIFGKLGFPALGMAGAALATVLSTMVATIVLAFMVFAPPHNLRFATLAGWRFDMKLFGRLIRYGFPNGVHFMIDMAGFTFFIFLVGRLGEIELAASGATFTLNMLVFMPMIGFAAAVSILVGQEVGARRVAVARRLTNNSFLLVFLYMGCMALSLIIFPREFLWLLLRGVDPDKREPIAAMATLLLRFVAFYSFFDAVGIVFSSAIKGAGDTRFVMWITLFLSAIGLVAPSYLVCVVWPQPVTWAWGIATAYICVLSLTMWFRYAGGRWESMSVIERPPEAELHSPLGPEAEEVL